MKNIVILGSTGSIGTQTLDVINRHPDKFKVLGLSAGNNIDLFIKQIKAYSPQIVVISNPKGRARLEKEFPNLQIVSGPDALATLASNPRADLVVISLVGAMAIEPALKAINAGKDIALATKEVLVAAGEIITKAARENKVNIYPIDSEHSAIAQCIGTARPTDINKIILTASGGPFLNWAADRLKDVTPADALKHPNWDMGAKITIDSATMMNKGLEVIEAYWMFSIPLDKIEVVIHPQSIVHSMVEFVDGSVIAQLGVPDMRLPIQYALSMPDRWPAEFPRLDFTQQRHLDFYPVDYNKYPALSLAYKAIAGGGTMPAVLNAANEAAVDLFLQKKIGFIDISSLVSEVMGQHKPVADMSLDAIQQADRWAREQVQELI
ncbi:MAG: 1-deoxy-D-xylulose-5-phosphate reductoisomerase [Candidatus Margulisiibacteriota bacterium]